MSLAQRRVEACKELIGFLGDDASDADTRIVFVDQVADALENVRSVAAGDVNTVASTVREFLKDYDKQVNQGTLQSVSRKLIEDYLNDKKKPSADSGKSAKPAAAAAAPAAAAKKKAKGGKKGHDDEDDDDAEKRVAAPQSKAEADSDDESPKGKGAAKGKQAAGGSQKKAAKDAAADEDEDARGGKKGKGGKPQPPKKGGKKGDESDEEPEPAKGGKSAKGGKGGKKADDSDEEADVAKGGKGGKGGKQDKSQKGGQKKKAGHNDEDFEAEEDAPKPTKGKGAAPASRFAFGDDEDETRPAGSDDEEEGRAPKTKKGGKKQEPPAKGGKGGKKAKDQEESEPPKKGQQQADDSKAGGKGAKDVKGGKHDKKQQGGKKGDEDDEDDDPRKGGKAGKGAKGGKQAKKGKKRAESDEEEASESEEEKPAAAAAAAAGSDEDEESEEEEEEERPASRGKGQKAKGGKHQHGKRSQQASRWNFEDDGGADEEAAHRIQEEEAERERQKAKEAAEEEAARLMREQEEAERVAREEQERKEREERERLEKERLEQERLEKERKEAEEAAAKRRKEESDARKAEEERRIDEMVGSTASKKARREAKKALKARETGGDDAAEEEEEDLTGLDEIELEAREEARREKAIRDAKERKEKGLPAAGAAAPVSVLDEQKKGSDSMSNDIKVEKFDLVYGKKVLFSNAMLTLNHGHKYGLVAPNGLGKSTLLRHIAARDGEFAAIPSHFDILYVEQEVVGTDASALETVVAADVERLRLLDEEKRLVADETLDPDGTRLTEVYARLDRIEAYSAEARASSILTGLQFTEEMKQQPTAAFSGGWRMRIALARALFKRPTLLLLDEPTNHLDLLAVIWLDTYLRSWKNTLLVVSHDQDFLNSVCTDIIFIYEQRLRYFKGNYDSYKKQFDEEVRIRRQQYEKQQKRLAEEKKQKSKVADKKAVEKKAKLDHKIVRNRQLKAGKAKGADDEEDGGKELLEAVPRDYEVAFEFPEPGALSIPIIQVTDASFGYKPDKLIFKDLDFGIDMESRIALVGPNGAGKSTLLKLLNGKLQPTTGDIQINRKLIIGRFSQHFVDQLNMSQTPIEYLRSNFPDYTEPELRKHLGRFGLTGQSQTQSIQLLSGGQKSRVVFAELSMRNPHLLFLDEPTNHLDIESIQALAEALNEFKGGLVLVSHDARLISEVCENIWVVGDNTVTIYDGDFEQYRQELMDEFEAKAEAEAEARAAKDEEKRLRREQERKDREAERLRRLAKVSSQTAGKTAQPPPASATVGATDVSAASQQPESRWNHEQQT